MELGRVLMGACVTSGDGVPTVLSQGLLGLGNWTSVHHDTGATLGPWHLWSRHLCPFVELACSRGLREGNNSFYLKGCIINKANTT